MMVKIFMGEVLRRFAPDTILDTDETKEMSMSQPDRPHHPSMVGEWGRIPPWQMIGSETNNLTAEFNKDLLNFDSPSLENTKTNNIDHISKVMMQQNAILCGDATTVLRMLPDDYFACCITSPPYWESRHSGRCIRLGAECDPHDYIRNLLQVFREVRRTLTPSGTLWLVIGDSYATNNPQWWEMYNKITRNESESHKALPNGFKVEDVMGIPWRLAIELQNDGWYLRSDIIWSIPNYPVEPSRDRPARVHNYVFLLARSERHMYNNHSLETPSRRTVWEIPTMLNSPIAYTVFPEALVERCMKAGTQKDDVVLDPFFGSGTVGIVAKRLKRRYVGIEIDPKTARLAGKRIREKG
jgi:site-specific DNA-methyltransferase (cytosine-N4-specific)